MPLRTRSGSSPIRSIRTGPQVLITSPSKNDGNRLRSGSHGALEFARRAANQERQSRRARAGTDSDSDAFQFDRRTRSSLSSYDNNVVRFEDPGEESDDSTALSSEFTETADSNPSVMKNPFNRLRPPPSATPMISYDLPPARPISMIQPISALTQLLRAKKPGNAMYDFSIFSGKGELRPLDCRIYCPKSSEPVKPMKILLRRDQRTDKGVRETTVAEAIGFALYTYIEEKIEPSLTEEQCDVNRWTFRMVEDDGEVDFDFPPLDRTKPITGYIPKDRRGAQRGPGEFALVQATQEQYEEHQRVTPNVNPTPAPSKPAPIEEVGEEPTPTGLAPAAAKALEIPGSQITPIARTGPTRILRIFMNTVDDFAKTVGLSVTTDTTFGEVLDLVCKKKHLNKAEFVLKIFGTTIIVSGDKTVETLGEDKDLELIRRSYRETPNLGASRTPSSFTTPILHSMTSTAPVAKKKAILQPHGGTPDVVFSLGYQKFVVYRRQPMSFINRHERVLAIDGEYVHVMPSDSKTIFESPKTISLHISSIVGCKTSKKNPHNFRVRCLAPERTKKANSLKIAVLKSEPRETKLYDFEATNTEQAFEIVNALKEKLETYKMDHPMDQRYYPKGFK